LNNKVSPSRLGHAYSAHGITGTLGWAIAPLLMTGVTLAYSWRTALAVGGLVAVAVLVVLLFNHGRLAYTPVAVVKKAEGGSMDFLKEPAVWMCFAFSFMFAMVLGVVQAFAPGATRELHGVALATMALCLTIYMCGSAGGMVLGGFLIKDPMRCERVVAVGFAFAACVAVALALLPMPAWLVPVMFGLMGFASGTAGPSRDLLVKQSTPPGATAWYFRTQPTPRASTPTASSTASSTQSRPRPAPDRRFPRAGGAGSPSSGKRRGEECGTGREEELRGRLRGGRSWRRPAAAVLLLLLLRRRRRLPLLPPTGLLCLLLVLAVAEYCVV
jgi:MFS family permease